MEFPEEYFDHIKKNYFEEYINKNICHIYKIKNYEILYCDNNEKFNKKNIKNFSTRYFNNVDKDFSVHPDGNDLFYFKDNK